MEGILEKKNTIMIVDDTPSIIGIVLASLEEEGYLVSVARNGEEAIKRVAFSRPDLILLDILMPGMDGYETCKRLKSDENTKGVPVIFMSALHEPFDKVRGFEVGAVDYITKPIETRELLARVQTHLTISRLQRELQELNATLEEKVAKRTGELSLANERLQDEIDERRRAEEELEKVNRALKILSESNQVLIRGTEEKALLQDVCSIITEIGEYPLVWVGFAEHDEEKTVRPVAQMGFEDGYVYLKTATITWADTERGRGSTGTAIRTGKPGIANNILTDFNFPPWREAAVKRGYHSALALPLCYENRVLGALSIYAKEPDAFHDDEIDLLMELAGDLAFGIMALRVQEERRRAEEFISVSRNFLELANRHMDLKPMLDEFVKELQKILECTAVGIRLLDAEENIPYQAYAGFSSEFYESESPLSIKRDQCMCIHVIKGDTNPGLPFFTEGGSFFMNGTTSFLATVSEEEKGSTRNICNIQGYESVALAPIMVEDRIIGLIHVADYGENSVPLDRVELLERLAVELGANIQRVWAEEELKSNKERMQLALKVAVLGLWDWNVRTNALHVNERWLEMFGYSPDELEIDAEIWMSWIHPKDRPKLENTVQYHMENRTPFYQLEYRARNKTGKWAWIWDHGKVVERDSDGKPLRMAGIHQDITDRKQVEEERIRLAKAVEQAGQSAHENPPRYSDHTLYRIQ